MAASKMKQILKLEPDCEIPFQGPFEHVVTSYLELKNPTNKRVCFKVKTTAPKRYCVRPNSGIVEPDGKVRIAIMLQPLDPDSEAEARSRHKFMVQSTIIQNHEMNIPLEQVWQKPPEFIMDSKLRCVFHSPEQQDGDNDGDAVPVGGPKQRKTETSATPDPAGYLIENMILNAAATATSGGSEQPGHLAGKQKSSGGGQAPEIIRTSTPVSPQVATSKLSSTQAASAANQYISLGLKAVDRSIASSNNLTSSFMQPMSDDYKIVLVSLVMLVLGVILGKYII